MNLHREIQNRRSFFKQAALTSLVWGQGLTRSQQILAATPNFVDSLFGVNLAGAEFGTESTSFSNDTPGRHGYEYTYGHKSTVAFFCDQRLPLIRVPFRWERIQPRLRAPLDREELLRLLRLVGWIDQCGGQAILDVHNYGRYYKKIRGKIRECVLDDETAASGPPVLSRRDLGDLWRRLALVFGKQPAVVGYGLMNEPHDLPVGRWREISNYVVQQIRLVDRKTSVIVAGDCWSNAERFAQINGPKAWIRDPADNVVYEAHCYFDHDSSGKYHRSFKEELARDPQTIYRGRTRIKPFLDWCQYNKVPGLVGEFGVPTEPGWLHVLEDFAALLQLRGIPGCYWAAGEFWGSYPLSIQPRDGQLQPQHVALAKFI